MTTIHDATNHNNPVLYLIFIYAKTQLTLCLVSTNLSLMSRTLSSPRLQLHSTSCLIWCKLLIKNLKPPSPISLPLRLRCWICFKTCSCWLRHDFINYNLNCSEWKTTKHIIATMTSRLASLFLRHRWEHKIFVTSQTQLTSCLLSINLSLMSRTLSAPRLQFISFSRLIWCKLLIKNLKPSSPIFQLKLRLRSLICFKTCPCWLRHED